MREKQHLVRLLTPPLEALYPAMVGMAMTAFTEDMLMMAPPRPGDILFCSTIWRAAAWPVCQKHTKLTRLSERRLDAFRMEGDNAADDI